MKIFLDGSAGGRTAWMSAPYLPGPGRKNDEHGVQILPDEQLARIQFFSPMNREMKNEITDAAVARIKAAN